jgi:hypothetical protein
MVPMAGEGVVVRRGVTWGAGTGKIRQDSTAWAGSLGASVGDESESGAIYVELWRRKSRSRKSVTDLGH